MKDVDRLRFFFSRFRERLWFRPLVICGLSIAGVFVAKTADGTDLGGSIPTVTTDSIEALLSIMAASMLVIATFTVASMVSAYSSASDAATPRSFTLVLADDVSQNALSTFVGSFIYSIVGLTAVKNDFFQEAGRTALFALTVFVFAIVILTFVRWIDRIARLGRLGNSVEKVEEAAEAAIRRRRAAPTLRGAPAKRRLPEGHAVYAKTVGYVQLVDVAALHAFAEESERWVSVAALPGTFAGPGRAIAYVEDRGERDAGFEDNRIAEAFVIGRDRLFDEDPRFGLVVLSEIADKALSPAVNDPGTAIAVMGTLVRLFALWAEPLEEPITLEFDRVEVPELSMQDMFDDAFTAVARDGAGFVEVAIRLQKALASLSTLDHPAMRNAAIRHARSALERAEKRLDLPEDLKRVREAHSPGGQDDEG